MLDINSCLGFQPKTPQRSILRLQGSLSPSNLGRYRTFNLVVENIGEAVTYIKDAVDGDKIVINEDGLYIITYSDSSASSTEQFAVVRNPGLDAYPISNFLPARMGDFFCFLQMSAAQTPVSATSPAFLKAGDILKMTNTGVGSVGANVYLQRVEIAKVIGF